MYNMNFNIIIFNISNKSYVQVIRPGNSRPSAWDAADSEVQSPALPSRGSPARCACGRRPLEARVSSPASDQHQTRADEAGSASDSEAAGGDRGPACEAPTPTGCDPANS